MLFRSKIEGTLNKKAANKVTLYFDLELAEVDDISAYCSLIIGSNLTSDLSCDLNVEDYKDIKIFSFKPSKVSENGYEINLIDIDTIILMNSDKIYSKKELFKKIGIYGGAIVGGVLLIILIICLIKSKKAKQLPFSQESGLNPVNNMNSRNQQGYKIATAEGTTNRKQQKDSHGTLSRIKIHKNKKSNKKKDKTKRKNNGH